KLGFELDVKIQRSVEQARAAATTAIPVERMGGGFENFRMGNQIEVIVGAEHQHLAIPHADLTRAAAFVLAEDFEVHIKTGRLQVRGPRKATALLKQVFRPLAPGDADGDGVRSTMHSHESLRKDDKFCNAGLLNSR